MADIQVTRDTGPAEIETLLASGRLETQGVRIPNSLKHAGALGVSLALTQLLLTWSRRNGERILRTYLEPGDRNAYKTFTGRVHGLAAAYFADRVEATDGTDIRRPLLESARERFRAMHTSDVSNTARGSEIEFIFVQGAKSEFHGALYSKAPSAAELADREAHGHLVESPTGMNALIANCAKALSLEGKLGRIIGAKNAPLGQLLHEAFRNTAEHAYYSSTGDPLLPNLRCVRIGLLYVNRDNVSSASVSRKESQTLAASYFQRIAAKESQEKRARIMFFEISVLDSGDGFVSTISKANAKARRSDRDAVIQCFGKHISAKPGHNSGLGLNRILKEVHELDGFLRVRTNTVEAFYAPVDGLHPDCPPQLYVHGGLSAVEGTLLTVALPVGY